MVRIQQIYSSEDVSVTKHSGRRMIEGIMENYHKLIVVVNKIAGLFNEQ